MHNVKFEGDTIILADNLAVSFNQDYDHSSGHRFAIWDVFVNGKYIESYLCGDYALSEVVDKAFELI